MNEPPTNSESRSATSAAPVIEKLTSNQQAKLRLLIERYTTAKETLELNYAQHARIMSEIKEHLDRIEGQLSDESLAIQIKATPTQVRHYRP